ncbi:flagellar motor switch protein FliG [Methylobacterium sp. Leaf469]|uniref:flagellar motor switch protein FliG n=1 Tax=unclassified Methylobacterium TaxID=2615210 RepID=UPI0006F849FE|nr:MULTISPECIES: flagellar motor switch protein FliG [unclassified Methylobacterium]USU31020.1 flagellar motor switch protein FliG [Methylobacterium sp. OTU13CASTA1]KQO68478.1 flagellar motor switch protein FliG [Methylobacterium sp. Leaf87]KQP24706.1 flagellar motor switch protein FliG [Methylobacterium sp. Leaf102]KQP35998.1 flagellar motor switch protein FliG [Methylobacterium sp. Leaf100]KQP60500.1 flagellar motor switch protein FliG [Methylobacterium sp. Leaf112]
MSSGLNIAAELANAGGAAFAAMPGTQRAAALLLLLGDTEGAPIWQMLDEDEVKKVSHAMVQLGSLEAETVEKLIVDFVSRLSSGGGITSNFERTESLLLKIFPQDQVSSIMAEIKGASGKRVWASLTQIDPEILASFLRNEYPQTVAVVLSKVRSEYAAKVLTILPEDFAIDVLNRMLRMETVQKEALRHIEETLRVEFVSTIAQTTRRDAHELMADVFNAFDRQTEGRFLAALDQANRGSAKKIRQLMFTFEDLLKLDPGSVQTLLRKIDNDTLCRALKGAEERVRGFFLSNMSTRAAKNITDEMGSLGPIRLKEVDEAQAKMTELAKDLAEKGEIMIAKSSGEEELVY